MTLTTIALAPYNLHYMNYIICLLALTLAITASAKDDPAVYHHEGRDHKIKLVKKLNPVWWLANEDRPYDESFKFFGKTIDDSKPHKVRKALFAVRNPGHNFTHYVIGVSDRDFTRHGPSAAHVWNQDPDKKHNPCLIKEGVLIPRPFISRKGPLFESYIGWRQDGNFGIALRKAQKKLK